MAKQAYGQTYGDWIRSNPPLPTKEYKTKHMAQETSKIGNSDKSQTAVEWLGERVREMGFLHHVAREDAKQMYKEQMIDFGKKCQMVHDVEYGDGAVTFLFTPEQLFEETYKK